MTVMEFLDKLAATERKWKLTPSGAIRLRKDLCPYAAVANGEALGALTGPGAVEWVRIFDAADNVTRRNSKIRRALLDACGLTAGS